MKRISGIFLLLICLTLTACNSASIGIIGGADGPTSIIIGETGLDEKEPIRMVNVGGALYYDIDSESEIEARCGVMDGSFTKTVERFEIPKNDGESNFAEGKGYQRGMHTDTIEILIGDDWEIFKKLDTNRDVLKYTYCYTVEGMLPNAHDDSELLVLADTMDISFKEASYQLFGSNSDAMKDMYVLPIVDR